MDSIIRSHAIETEAVTSRSDDAGTVDTSIDADTVTVTGSIPTNVQCPDFQAVLDDITLADSTLNLTVELSRENPESPCLSALGQVEYQATVVLKDTNRVKTVCVFLPGDEKSKAR